MTQIKKVLIANRGEIALRVIKTLKDMAIKSVAIYAESDINALYVSLADEAWSLKGETPNETFLNINKIIDIAVKSGADAIHPGYGFLSENEDFAKSVIDNGLIWIGPPPHAINSLGNKTSARQIALKVNAPLAPGLKDPVATDKEITDFAENYGFPIAIKAAYGGGGRGLKIVENAEDIPLAFDSAKREALKAFGRDECFVEKFIINPRHVETQCLADKHGTVQVISTRDCSLQRRNQKLVEEAPAPFLTEAQNKILYESSKAILKEAGYEGAGTCEFLLTQEGDIYFLEVNTRLQVEHPVTEEITGIDLVKSQIEIAEGKALETEDPACKGAAIEFRLNAEDPNNSFLPQTGYISKFVPSDGIGVRLDTGIKKGDIISGQFDSLLAKLIIKGENRNQALARAKRALTEFKLEGFPTTLEFHKAIVDNPDFLGYNGFNVHTKWIENDCNAVFAPIEHAENTESYIAQKLSETKRQNLIFELEGKRLEVSLPTNFIADAGIASENDSIAKIAPKRRFNAFIGEDDTNIIKTPMQGSIVKIQAKEGDIVKPGDVLVVLEAMKMEQPIIAKKHGRVKDLDAPIGITLPQGHKLLTLEDID